MVADMALGLGDTASGAGKSVQGGANDATDKAKSSFGGKDQTAQNPLGL